MKRDKKIDAAAIDWYVEIKAGEASWLHRRRFKQWIAGHAAHKIAYERVCAQMERMTALNRSDVEKYVLVDDEASSLFARIRNSISWSENRGMRIAVAAFSVSVAIMIFGVVQIEWLPGEAIATGRGQSTQVTLNDHSVVRLNTLTNLVANITATERSIFFREGEAYFEVAKDPGRPFRVTLGGQIIEAVGTAFNIYLVDNIARVTVTEGAVRIFPTEREAAGMRAVHLDMGKQMTLNTESGEVQITDAEIDVVSAWLEGQIVFREMPLEDVVDQFSRYSWHYFVFRDEELKRIRVSGTFDPTDINSLNAALELAFPIKITTLAGTMTFLSSNEGT